jgi:hypothetical protein
MENQRWVLISGTSLREIEPAVKFLECEFNNPKTNLHWTSALMEWKIGNKNPSGKGILFAAKVADDIIATATLTLKKLYYNDDEYLIGEIGDTYTSLKISKKGILKNYACQSEYRGTYEKSTYIQKSLFGRLVAEIVDWADSEGIKLIYGTANNYSCAGYIKRLGFNYVRTHNYNVESKIIITGKLLKAKFQFLSLISSLIGKIIYCLTYFLLIIPIVKLKKFNISKLDVLAGDEFDRLWDSALNKNGSIIRNKDWLVWRYQINPEKKYNIYKISLNDKLYGWVVIKIENTLLGRTIVICDYLFIFDTLRMVAFLFKILKSLNYQDAIVKFWITKNSLIDKKLWSIFNLKIKQINLIYKPLGDNSINPGFLFDDFLIGHSDNV